MDPLTVSILISAPREQVFDYLQDIANHGDFSWGDSTFAEIARPHRIVEVGRTGKANRVRTLGVYELAPAPGGATRVQFTLETEATVLSDRMMEAFGGRAWLKRKNEKAMRRLRSILETGAGRGERVTLAGG